MVVAMCARHAAAANLHSSVPAADRAQHMHKRFLALCTSPQQMHINSEVTKYRYSSMHQVAQDGLLASSSSSSGHMKSIVDTVHLAATSILGTSKPTDGVVW